MYEDRADVHCENPFTFLGIFGLEWPGLERADSGFLSCNITVRTKQIILQPSFIVAGFVFRLRLALKFFFNSFRFHRREQLEPDCSELAAAIFCKHPQFVISFIALKMRFCLEFGSSLYPLTAARFPENAGWRRLASAKQNRRCPASRGAGA